MTVGTQVAPPAEQESREHVPLGPSIWFAIVAVGMAGVVPAVVMAMTPLTGDESAAWIWAVPVVLLSGLRFAWLVAKGQLRLFEIVFWLFTYVFIGLAPLAQMRANSYPGTTPDIDTTLNGRAMGVVWVGLAAFLVGLAIASVRRQKPDEQRTVSLVAQHRLTIFCVVVLLGCLAYLARIGPASLFLSRAARGDIEAIVFSNSTVGAIVSAFTAFAPVIAFAALMRLRRQRKARGEVAPVFWAWAMLALIVLIDNPVSTPRFVTGTAALGVVVALGGASRPRRLRILAVSLLVGMVLVFPLLDLFRYTTTTAGDSGAKSLSETLMTPDFDAIDQINNAVWYVDVNGTRGGQQNISSVLFFVPRATWPTKAEDTGVLLADFRGYKVTNLSAPVSTELYIDGAWFLLVVGMGLLGFVLRRTDDAAVASFRTFPAPGVLAGTLPFYLIIMLRGSLLQSMAGFTTLVVCAAVVGRRVPASRVQDELTAR